MKNKNKAALGVIITIVLTSLSCSGQPVKTENRSMVVSGRNDSLQWELKYPDHEFLLTDLIPVNIRVTGEEGKSVTHTLMDNSKLWGDFRIYSFHFSEGSLDLLLQPVHTGPSFIQVPSPDDPGIEIQPIKVQIKSVLDDGVKDPAPLIEMESQKHRTLLILAVCALIIAAVLVLVFVIIKRRNKPDEQEESLKYFLYEIEKKSFKETELKEIYVKIYRLLLKDLQKSHPGVKASDSPSELKAHLEIPSAMNQWAIRSLYPVLDTMDSHFFKDSREGMLLDSFSRDMQILNEWVSFIEDLDREDKK